MGIPVPKLRLSALWGHRRVNFQNCRLTPVFPVCSTQRALVGKRWDGSLISCYLISDGNKRNQTPGNKCSVKEVVRVSSARTQKEQVDESSLFLLQRATC